jgi:4-amino-4-deoxy-L-arabinose transferase-like glycosyltransferase
MMAAMRDPRLLAVLLVALAVRIATLHAAAAEPVARYQLTWVEGDMAMSWRWAGRIAAGDLLTREPVHQYTSWMLEMAPRATWERWWGGALVFHQAPLYAYALGAVRALGAGDFTGIALFHGLLGLLDVVLVYALAAPLFGPVAATLAALGAACYGPELLHEALALRDTLAVTTALVLLVALSRAGDRPRRWLVAGLAFAAATLARETTLLFAPVLPFLVAGRPRRAQAALAAGVVLGLLPLVVRNVAVGVAPWALSTRGLEGFVYGHAAGGSPIGLALPPATRDILTAADGSLLRAIRLTLDSWHGDWAGLAAHQLGKLAAVVAGYEAADNASFYYFAERLPAVGLGLRLPPVLGLAVLGLACAPRRTDDRALRWYLATAVLGLLYATVVARYRLPAVAVLLVYAGGGAVWLVDRVRRRRWRAAAVGAAVALVTGLVSATLLAGAPRFRGAEYLLAAEDRYRAGDAAAAAAELDAGLARAPRGPAVSRLGDGFDALVAPRVRLALDGGEPARAAALLEALVADWPHDPALRRMLGVVYRDALGEPGRAAEELEEARRLGG